MCVVLFRVNVSTQDLSTDLYIFQTNTNIHALFTTWLSLFVIVIKPFRITFYYSLGIYHKHVSSSTEYNSLQCWLSVGIALSFIIIIGTREIYIRLHVIKRLSNKHVHIR